MSVARVFKAPTPYNAGELVDMDYVQSFDVIYLAHLDHAPAKLVRSGHTVWAFSDVAAAPSIGTPTGLGVVVTNPNQDGSATPPGNSYFPQPRKYVVTAVDDQSGQESRASASASGTNDLTLKRNKNVMTWNPVTGAERYRIYAADNESDYGFIGETTGTTFTDDNIDPDTTDAPPEANNPFTAGNYPSATTFFEQRLWWARTRSHPNAIYASRSADFENYDISRPTKEDDGITFAIAAQKVNSVNSLVPVEELLALTGDGVFRILGSNQDYLAANPPPRAVRQSGRGANRLKPLVVDEVVFYQPTIGAEVRSLGFTFEIDGYRSSDVSIFSPGLFKGFTLLGWAYSEEPMSVIFAARSDGKMPSFTWQQEQQVWGWTLCETNGSFLDIVSVREGAEDRPYLLVRRTIAGVEKTFLERMASAKWEDVEESCYLDCAITIRPDTPTSRFLVPHLAGATVDALADGFVITGKEVDADGYVELGYEVERIVTIGLPYETLIETLPLMMETREGWPRNKRQMLGDVVVQVADTRLGSIEVGRRLSKMYRMKARHTEALGTATDLFTGSGQGSTEPYVSGEATLFIRSTEPTPMTVTAVYLDPKVSED